MFIALRGWPVNTITRRPLRLFAGNGLVIGLGALTYLVLRNIAHWPPAAIGAACGCVISAALVVAMLFEGWPAARLPSAASRALTLALTALVALALDRALASYADGVQWTRATPGRVDHHRRAQLRLSRHHPARRHRAPLAVRLEDRLA